MRKSTIFLIVLLPIIFLIGLEIGSSATAQQLHQLNSEIQELRSEINQLNSELNQKDEYINQLQQWLEGNISIYENNISMYKAEISYLRKNLEIEVLGIFFSPKGECEETIIKWINNANKSIHILIYSFTLDSIANALINAHNRGVDVKVVFEKSQIGRGSEYQRLKKAGVPVRNDTNSHLMHNKVMIIDGKIVFTGSYNWSFNAEKYNDENLIVIKSEWIAEEYEKKFEEIWNNAAE